MESNCTKIPDKEIGVLDFFISLLLRSYMGAATDLLSFWLACLLVHFNALSDEGRKEGIIIFF